MRIPLRDAEIDYYEDFITFDESMHYMQLLLTEVNWKQNKIKIFGKEIDEPRLASWYADDGVSYAYSGIQLEGNPWSSTLSMLKHDIESLVGMTFNSALLNYYRDGSDSMGWHQDNEKELGENPAIASLTLGATRTFQLKHITDKSLARKDIPLSSGSLLIMHGATQHHWKHQIPKTKKPIGARLNITFRKIKN